MPLSQCRRSVVLRHLYLFIAYLNGTRDFWFTATPPDTPAPLSPASAITSAGDSISTRAAFANVVGSVMSVVPSDPAPSTPATGRRPRSSDSNSATLPQPIKRQQRFYAFDSAPRAEMNDNGSKEKSSANPLGEFGYSIFSLLSRNYFWSALFRIFTFIQFVSIGKNAHA